MKTSSIPYYPRESTILASMTDMDHFPYNRFYRGVANSEMPVVFEREVGWRPVTKTKREDCCQTTDYPNTCFQLPCSIVLPCYDTRPDKNICISLFR